MLINWTGDYDSHNVIYDLPEHLRCSCLSKMKYWHPEDIIDSPTSKIRGEGCGDDSFTAIIQHFFRRIDDIMHRNGNRL